MADTSAPNVGRKADAKVPDKDEVEDWLLRQIATIVRLPVTDVDSAASLTALGMSSLRRMRLRERVLARYGVETPMSADSARAIADHILAPGGRPDAGATDWTPVPRPAERYEPFPLTDLQRAYFLGRSTAMPLGGTGCHAYYEFDLPGADVEALQQAWQRVVERHDMLRAVVTPDGRQCVRKDVEPYRFTTTDLREAPAETVERRVSALREAMSHESFPLDQWPLFHIAATELPGEAVRLHVSIDLLIADLWSLRILFGEWWRLYERPSTVLPPCELTFRDCVLTRAGFEESAAYRRADAYWRSRAPRLPAAPQLPTVGEGAPRFHRRAARIDRDVWRRISEQAARRGLTPSSTLLTAYASVLAGWSHDGRFTLDVTLFNRPYEHPDIEGVVGDFTSVDLLGIDLSTAGAFATAATEVQRRLWSDLEHSSAGGVRILPELGSGHGSSPGASLPVVFTSALGSEDGDGHSLFGGFGMPSYGITQTPQVHLDHQVYEDSGALHLVWDSREGAFPEGLLDDMFAAYQALVERLAEPGTWTVPPRVPLPAWQVRAREQANSTAGPVPEGTLTDRVLAQAITAGENLAVATSDDQLTHRRLSGLAVATAQRLAETGHGPGDLVGIALPKGPRQIIATVAASAAGCTYVPIDPDLPAARREWLVRHAGITCLIAEPGTEHATVPAITVEQTPATTEQIANWKCPAQPQDIAYVIYTSGSTGTPKGVAVTHEAALNTLVDINERHRISAQDRVLALSSLSFDLSVYDIFGVLATGGALILPRPTANRDPAHWLDLIHQHRVTVWNTVPALMQMLIEYHEADQHTLPLKTILLSGDWIPVSLPPRIHRAAPEAHIISLGGATEAAVWSIQHPIGQVDPDQPSIPYGKPLRNQRFHVLNAQLDPAPVWVPGDLYIAGTGLAHSYWNDAERTHEAFITHPTTKERLYRTGDLGRYLPDGTIEFLGRHDTQVKISGYRIELGEIEHTITNHPHITHAAVTATGPRDNRRLVAFVTTSDRDGDAVSRLFGEVETDPAARLRFKSAQHGLRALPGPTTPLAEPAPAPPPPGSCRSYDPAPVPADGMSTLLAAVGTRPGEGRVTPRRAYGSAGSLYPVQAYVIVKKERVEGVAAGSYYFDPVAHELVRCDDLDELSPEWLAPDNRELAGQAAFAILLVARHSAIRPLYGRLARDFCLLEAGLMAHSLQLSAAQACLGTCQVGGTHDAPALRAALLLEEDHELLHVLVGGVPAGESGPVVQDLEERVRESLRQRLPSYMVPEVITTLDRLPLTAQGKLDRRALAEMAEQVTAVRVYTPPSGESETAIAEVLCEVLGVERVGATVNFFEAGGTSVKLTAAHARLQRRLGRTFPLLALFEHTTARTLAAWLDGRPAEDDSDAADRARRRRAARRRRRTDSRPDDGENR